MFDQLVISYLFLGGWGSGALLVASLASLLFFPRRNRSFEQTCAFDGARSALFLVSVIVLAFSAVCLLADLGRPERALYLFTRPTDSLLSIGAHLLVAGIALSGALFCLTSPFRFRVRGKIRAVVEALAALAALAVMSYTGFYLYGLKAVPLWDTPLVPLLFVVSSVSCGLSTFAVVAAVRSPLRPLERTLRRQKAVHVAVISIEAAALAAYVWWMAQSPFTAPSLQLLLSSNLAYAFIGGLVALGLAVPLLSEALAIARGRVAPLLLSDALVLSGALCLRYCIVVAASH